MDYLVISRARGYRTEAKLLFSIQRAVAPKVELAILASVPTPCAKEFVLAIDVETMSPFALRGDCGLAPMADKNKRMLWSDDT